MPSLIAAGIGLSVALLVVAMFRKNALAVAEARAVRMALPEADPDPLATSFAHRVLQPLASRLSAVLMVVLPGRVLGSLRAKLEMAGSGMTLRALLVTWAVVALMLPLGIFFIMIVSGAELGAVQLLMPPAWAVVTTYMSWVILRRKAQARATSIQRGLPDAIDLIITNIEAGLGLQAALLAVSDRMSGTVAEEFGRAVREISLGRERTMVFDAMAERSGVQEMRLFARAVAQSERTGFPIARILRNHAAEMRDRRRQLAREKAAKVPIKIIFPTVLFIFPTLFLVILGPIVIYAMGLIGNQ